MKQNFARILPSIILGMMLSFGALAEQPVGQVQAEAAKVDPAVVEVDSGYQIGPEDILEISVWKEEGLKKEVLVRPDGGLSFPLIGEVQAA